jgi:hypothetical protein
VTSWRKCQWQLRTLGTAGWGGVKFLVVEKPKAALKTWSWANPSQASTAWGHWGGGRVYVARWALEKPGPLTVSNILLDF